MIKKREIIDKKIFELFRFQMSILFKSFRHFDIQPPQHAILKILEDHGPMNITALSQEFFSDISATAKFVKRLEKKELLEVQRAEFDRRNKIICLTSKGKELLEITENMVMKTDELAHEVLTDKEIKDFNKILDKLLRAAKDSFNNNEE